MRTIKSDFRNNTSGVTFLWNSHIFYYKALLTAFSALFHLCLGLVDNCEIGALAAVFRLVGYTCIVGKFGDSQCCYG